MGAERFFDTHSMQYRYYFPHPTEGEGGGHIVLGVDPLCKISCELEDGLEQNFCMPFTLGHDQDLIGFW